MAPDPGLFGQVPVVQLTPEVFFRAARDHPYGAAIERLIVRRGSNKRCARALWEGAIHRAGAVGGSCAEVLDPLLEAFYEVNLPVPWHETIWLASVERSRGSTALVKWAAGNEAAGAVPVALVGRMLEAAASCGYGRVVAAVCSLLPYRCSRVVKEAVLRFPGSLAVSVGGQRALEVAAREGHPNVCQVLHRFFHDGGLSGQRALVAAAGAGQLDVCKVLLWLFADALEWTDEARTAACCGGHDDVLDWAMQAFGVN